MDEVTHTILPNSGGISGNALSAGFGGLIGSWLGNGFGGFGGFNRGPAAGAVGYDTGALNAMQGQLNSISGQITAADRDFLMQTSAQNQFLGNMINSGTDALAAAVNGSARDIQAGINQNTIAGIQASNAQNLALCNGFGGVNAALPESKISRPALIKLEDFEENSRKKTKTEAKKENEINE